MPAQTSELTALVKQEIIDNVPDALERSTPLMNHLTTAGKKKLSGGLYIQFPMKLIANTAQGHISGTNALTSINPSPQLQYGVLNWKYYNFNTNFTLADMTIASGENEVLDFMEEKVKGSLADSMRDISTALHGSSTTAPLNPEGLKDITAASGTAYAGLTDTDYGTGFYLPIINTSTTPNYVNLNSMITSLKARMQKDKFKASKYMGITNPAVYAKILGSLQNQQWFSEANMLKAGFDGFTINGIEFYMDADCPGSQDGTTGDNYIYIFPVDIMNLYHKFGFGEASPFDGETRMPNQPIMSIQHYMAYNLICTNRRLVAVNKVMVA